MPSFCSDESAEAVSSDLSGTLEPVSIKLQLQALKTESLNLHKSFVLTARPGFVWTGPKERSKDLLSVV